jgi:hypothetical protein
VLLHFIQFSALWKNTKCKQIRHYPNKVSKQEGTSQLERGGFLLFSFFAHYTKSNIKRDRMANSPIKRL